MSAMEDAGWGREGNTYRDGKVHVLAAMCGTCIFRPHERPVSGARVAELVRATAEEPGATVTCHSTLIAEGEPADAICRGWYDRMASRDPILQLAEAMRIIEWQPPPPKL